LPSFSIIFSGGFCEIVKHLLIAGGNPDAMTVTGVKPTDLTKYSSEIWNVINEAKQGDLPEIEEISEVCEIPEFSIPNILSSILTIHHTSCIETYTHNYNMSFKR
jgi:hypothetical protein